MLPDAFFHRDADRFVPTWATRGPWDPRFQHGGPPSALLATAMQEAAGAGMHLARLTTDFARPVPLAPLTLEVRAERVGRTVARYAATLSADRPVLHARGLFIRAAERPETPPEAAALSPAPWRAPDDCPPFVFPFFRWEEGYHRAIALRTADAEWGATPIRVWGRPRLPLVAGAPTTAEARVVLLADAESGLGPPLDPDAWAYANPDLTVAFARPPAADGWLGFDVRSSSGGAGAGISGAAIRDERGPVGQSVQTLVIDPRD